MSNSLNSDEMIIDNINKSINQLRMYTEEFNLFEEYVKLKNNIKELNKENKHLKKQVEDLTIDVETKNEDLANFKKVSYIQSMSKQLTDKDNYIKILEHQLNKQKSNDILDKEPSIKSNKVKVLTAPEGYEYFEYNDDKFLKDLETNKLYSIYENKPDAMVGVIKSSGKIKFY